ncbi:hypothetical protein [uncultured Maribacter sp.]|uniref:hypothetical protein n=1 Tax=uncultured Maribacter sp. TaxID=431308 RepID=UPI002620EA3C|nr:hypothetical protein [uncultured Maribacter sp.]
MELEEIQYTWGQMSLELEKQKRLSKKNILEMTHQKYKNKFSRLLKFELMGALICFVFSGLILYNFSRLDTWYLWVCGIFTLLILLVMPIITLMAIQQIKSLDILNISNKDALIKYTKTKSYLLAIQQFGAYASFPVFLTSMPVMSKILKNKDFFSVSKDIWFYVMIVLFGVGLYFFIKWGIGCYKRITNSAEEILKELDEY